MTEKGISKLENLEISKFVGGVFWECEGEKNDETSPYPLERGNIVTEKGECSDGKGGVWRWETFLIMRCN